MTKLVVGTALTLALVGYVGLLRHDVYAARWERRRLLNSLRGYA